MTSDRHTPHAYTPARICTPIHITHLHTHILRTYHMHVHTYALWHLHTYACHAHGLAHTCHTPACSHISHTGAQLHTLTMSHTPHTCTPAHLHISHTTHTHSMCIYIAHNCTHTCLHTLLQALTHHIHLHTHPHTCILTALFRRRRWADPSGRYMQTRPCSTRRFPLAGLSGCSGTVCVDSRGPRSASPRSAAHGALGSSRCVSEPAICIFSGSILLLAR